MPYGGTINATVSADLIQADVDAIIQGLTGSGGKTFTHVHDLLNMVIGYLSGQNTGPLTNNEYSLWMVVDYLDMIRSDLVNINDKVSKLSFDSNNRLKVTTS